MLKNSFLIIIALLVSISMFAQDRIDTVKPFQKGAEFKPLGRNFLFEYKSRQDNNVWIDGNYMAADTAIYTVLDWVRRSKKGYIDSVLKADPKKYPPGYFSEARFKSKIILGISLDPKLTVYQTDGIVMGPKNYPAYVINNNSKAFLVAMGIDKSNVKDYRYHIVENDSVEVVPWTMPQLEQKYGAKVPYGGFGELYAPGKQLMIEIVSIKDYRQREGVVFDWRTNVKPQPEGIFGAGHRRYFQIADSSVKDRYATKFDPITKVPSDLKFTTEDVEYITVRFKYHAPISYSVYLIRNLVGAKKDTIRVRQLNAQETDLDLNRDDNYPDPGKYEIVIQPHNQLNESQFLRIPFEVLPPVTAGKAFTLKEIIPYAAGVIVIVILIFAGYYIYSKRKLKKTEQQKALANLKLSSVRSQLNPHFMFNALTSIQNLMNQQDTEGANHYLNKFAGLTRQVLKTSGQELASLEDEVKLMTDYLQMEQLRFGFAYDVNIDAGINQANTDIPTMLLQPFIENAAKYGVSALQSEGKITVNINKQQRDLVLSVADNGLGFSTTNNTEGNGVGIKLSKERIDLLNQIYKDQPISLNIDSTSTGVITIITLTDWL